MALSMMQDFKRSSLTLAAIRGPTFSLTAAGTRYYFDRDGIIQSAGSGVARTAAHWPDKNGVFQNRGIWLENAATNICLQSEDFSTTWANTNTGETTNATSAPDGNTTADEITSSTTSDVVHSIYQDFTGLTANQATVVSLFVKPGTNLTRAQLIWSNSGYGDGAYANFNLTNGTVTVAATALAAGTALKAWIYPMVDGWFHLALSGQIATGTTGRFTINMIDNDSAAANEASNLATNDSLYMWGAMIETNKRYPSSYVPTTTTSVARVVDRLSTTDMSFLDAAASAEGMYCMDVLTPWWYSSSSNLNFAMELDDGGTSDRQYIRQSTDYRWSHSVNNSVGATGSAGGIQFSYEDGVGYRIAAQYEDNYVRILHGSSGDFDSNADFPLGAPDNMTTLWLGGFVASTLTFDGFIKDLRWWDALDNEIYFDIPPFYKQTRGNMSGGMQ